MADTSNHTSSYSRGPHPSQRRYPPELRDRAVRMVRDTIAQTGQRAGVITRVARQLGIGTESLQSWVRQAEVDGGYRPGLSTAEQQRLAELERENPSCGAPMRSWSLPRLSSGQCQDEARPVGFARFFAAPAVAGGLSGDVRPRRAVRPGGRRGLIGACLVLD